MSDIVTEILDKSNELRKLDISPKFISLNEQGAKYFVREMIAMHDKAMIPDKYRGMKVILNCDQENNILVLGSAEDEFKYNSEIREVRNND